MTVTPRLYVACLACYNSGRLHGTWIDADPDPEVMGAELLEFFSDREDCESNEPADDLPELAVHDHEGFGGMWSGEDLDLDKVSEIVALLREHGDVAIAAFDAAGDLDTAKGYLENGYRGPYSWLQVEQGDAAAEFHEEMGTELGSLENYVDWSAVQRDLLLGGDWVQGESPEGVYFFRGH